MSYHIYSYCLLSSDYLRLPAVDQSQRKLSHQIQIDQQVHLQCYKLVQYFRKYKIPYHHPSLCHLNIEILFHLEIQKFFQRNYFHLAHLRLKQFAPFLHFSTIHKGQYCFHPLLELTQMVLSHYDTQLHHSLQNY